MTTEYSYLIKIALKEFEEIKRQAEEYTWKPV